MIASVGDCGPVAQRNLVFLGEGTPFQFNKQNKGCPFLMELHWDSDSKIGTLRAAAGRFRSKAAGLGLLATGWPLREGGGGGFSWTPSKWLHVFQFLLEGLPIKINYPQKRVCGVALVPTKSRTKQELGEPGVPHCLLCMTSRCDVNQMSVVETRHSHPLLHGMGMGKSNLVCGIHGPWLWTSYGGVMQVLYGRALLLSVWEFWCPDGCKIPGLRLPISETTPCKAAK